MADASRGSDFVVCGAESRADQVLTDRAQDPSTRSATAIAFALAELTSKLHVSRPLRTISLAILSKPHSDKFRGILKRGQRDSLVEAVNTLFQDKAEQTLAAALEA